MASFSTADHTDTARLCAAILALRSESLPAGRWTTIGSLVKVCSARSTGRGREWCATTLEPMPGYEDGFCLVHQADEPRKRLCRDSSGFSLVSDTCRAPRPAAGALAISEHRVAYVGAVAGEGDQDLPFSPSAGLLLI